MKDVINKSLACLVVFFLFLCVSLIFTGTVDYKSRFLSFLPQLNNSTFCRTGLPLRVYMYDLPRRFNVGMIDGSLSDEIPVRAENFPAWRENNGLRKQHSVEYWMMASLLYNGDGGGDSESSREVVRVMDPKLADVFFVPFFASLSFNVHGRNMTDPDTEIDIKLQHEIVEILRGSEHWQRSAGRDHVIPIHHPNAFRIHRDKLNASIFIVADFGRIMGISRLEKDVVAPYVHMVESYLSDNDEDPYRSRKTLLFFRGRTVRKEEGLVRAKLKRILGKKEDVIYEEGSASEEGFRTSTEGMRSSKFCLNPAGDTPSSCRLFDAIVSHCVPVIVSDKIELPYESEIDYKEFSVFFSVKEALKPDYMLDQLKGIPKEKWIKMWSRLQSISHHFEYQYPAKKEDAVNMIWRQVREKLPALNLAVHRSRRLKVPDWWRRR
ncbi:probable arabinosyltransferase ARAD1 [Olea europaea var. sylvestris]|uniref:Probable arabinosyltransferase ARAD1 n=1 Tax=Olea europaea subsp. europaea TaxID=158383 RepID=A0A8S0QW10_OLEEU|nr:probable arabinosyltransferase ARAD1 [Olea europaea var. sylvestris]CAA2970048.1 probable arabinosyltransferase ARAD1 [Olea europaea subsp. europaea]